MSHNRIHMKNAGPDGSASGSRPFHEIDVLDAKYDLALAKEQLHHSEQSFKRGFAADIHVKTHRNAVEFVRQRLATIKAERPTKLQQSIEQSKTAGNSKESR